MDITNPASPDVWAWVASSTSTRSLTPTSGGRLPGAGAGAGEQDAGPGMEGEEEH